MKKKSELFGIMAGLVFSGGLAATGCGTVRGGYESAPYQVERASGKFEVRDYPALTVVETPMAREASESDRSFNRLFRFITGGNEAQKKIAMTTPVFMSGGETNPVMAFVMPADLKTGEVPAPLDDSVTVREIPPGQFAVLRYSGARNASNEAGSLAQLRDWIQSQGLKELSPPIYGYFDPPWTPPFLRRNEVMVKIEPASPRTLETSSLTEPRK